MNKPTYEELLAQNASLSEAIETGSDAFRRLDEQGAHIIGEEDVFLNLHVLYEKLLDINQSACLATIQAKAIEDAISAMSPYWDNLCSQDVIELDRIKEYAEKLRQQSTISGEDDE